MSIKLKVTFMLSVLGMISVGSGVYLFAALEEAERELMIWCKALQNLRAKLAKS